MVIKKQFYLPIFFIYSFLNLSASESNQLKKAFHHIGILNDNIAFYFNDNPIIKLISKKVSNGYIEELYQIPKSEISDVPETIEMVKKVNDAKHPFYKIKIIKNSNDIQIKIIYNTKFVKKVIPMSFNAISSFKGINFKIEHANIKKYLKYPHLPIGKIKNTQRPNVILDFGHGGEDKGAIGTNNIAEKQITLAIGRKLKKILDKKNYNVFLTRNNDKFIPLDQRTTMANLLEIPAIFVSIHANYSANGNACGIETYYADSALLNKFDFERNQVTPVIDEMSDEKNKFLALTIHESLCKKCKEFNKNIIDRKFKKSISQILLGSQMPTILIEIGFLSNKNECKMLSDAKYQETIAEGIFSGIEKYFSTTS